jgi:hypothetical protein
MQEPIICPSGSIFTTTDMIKLTSKYDYVVDKHTLNRKSFYESQEYDNLLIWDLRLSVLYYILAIILILILFVSKNQFQLTINQRLLVSLLVLIYPSIVNYFIKPIITVYRFFSAFVPKNVYNSI